MKKLILPVMAMFAAAGAYAEEAKTADMEPLKIVKTDNGMSELKHFPQAASGQVRHVIAVEPKSDEGQYKIELVVGKKQMVDCNRQWFGGTLTQKTVEGFGYDYYEAGDLTGPMSTMMGCLNNENMKRLSALTWVTKPLSVTTAACRLWCMPRKMWK